MTRLRSSVSSAFLSLTVLALGLAACGNDGAEPKDAQARLRATVPQITKATQDAMALLDNMPAMTWMETSVDATSVSFASLPFAIPTLGDQPPPVAALVQQFAAGEEGDFAEELITLVFNEESYEGEGYYRLRPEAVCGNSVDGTIDPECAKQVDAAEIRFRAVLAGDGLDISLAIGPDRAEPLTLELRSNRISLAVDLAAGKQAIAHLASISGEQVDLPEVMEGVLALSLVINGERDVSIEAAIRKDARIEATLPEGKLSFSSGAKDPLAALRLDGPNQAVTVSLDIGQTKVSGPWSMFMSESLLAAKLFSLDFGGLSATTTMRANDTSLTISNIGFGDSTTTMKADDTVLFAMNLNAELGRRFGMTIAPTATGTASIQLDPGFDLSLAFNFQPLATAGEIVEPYLLDETYRIAFTGTKPTAEPFAPDATSDGGIRITAGTLTISSTAAAAPVVVNAGQCLVENPLPDVNAHAVLGHLAVSDCTPAPAP